MRQEIYLDNAATTELDPMVKEVMTRYLDMYGNPASLHGKGKEARDLLEKAREQVADLLMAKPEQIIFTSGGSEANNLAIRGTMRYLKSIGKTHIVTSPSEHHSLLRAVKSTAEDDDAFTISYCKNNSDGSVDMDSLREIVSQHDDIGLISIMGMNNELGAVNNIGEIVQEFRGKAALIHTDCVQAAGYLWLDVNDIGCDMMSIASHKIHGPKGVGALYVKDKSVLNPIVFGGSNQEYGLRGGTENVLGIIGFGEACRRAKAHTGKIDRNIVENYYKRFLSTLEQEVDGFRVNSSKPGKILNITFDGADAESLSMLLDVYGVYISSGSACQSLESTPSHVLIAAGMDEEDARNTVRISFSNNNTRDEVTQAAHTVAECVKMLRERDRSEVE